MSIAAPVPTPTAKKRLWHLDNEKAFLTILVILHHAGQAYGPGGFWPVQNPARATGLGLFFWTNASFFMGLFFFISAYFMPGSYDRRGPGAFLKDRLVRFGIPLVLFVTMLNPLQMYLSYIRDRGGTLPFFPYLWQIYFGAGPRPANFVGPSWPDINFGHLWFIEHLLVYSLLYAAWRMIRRRPLRAVAGVPAASAGKAPGDFTLLGYALALGAVSLVVRIWYPIDRWVGALGFIQMEPAHLPQYVSMFVLGTVASRQNWPANLPERRGLRWLIIGLGAAVAGMTAILLRWAGGAAPATVSIILTIAEAFVATGLSVGLTWLFRRVANGDGKAWRFLSANAYGAYLLHPLLLVVLQYEALSLPAGPAARFLVVSALGVALSFLASHLLRKVPGTGHVL